jgi:hypothetical protein
MYERQTLRVTRGQLLVVDQEPSGKSTELESSDRGTITADDAQAMLVILEQSLLSIVRSLAAAPELPTVEPVRRTHASDSRPFPVAIAED